MFGPRSPAPREAPVFHLLGHLSAPPQVRVATVAEPAFADGPK
jgi:hypothetical protein